jgi:SAM-dependent methyltransferase
MRSRPIRVEPVTCQGCGSSGPFVHVATGPDYDNHACGDQEFTLVRCSACATCFLNPRPTADMLPIIYSSESYYAYTFSSEGNPVVVRARQRRDGAKVTQVLRHLRRPPADLAVLDIGSGDGSLLEAFEAAGVPAAGLTGLELDTAAVTRLRGRGYAGITTRIEEADLGRDRFDVITMIQLIEHVADPLQVIDKCRAALRPGGVLLIETPNMASWDRPLFARRLWGGYHFPRHWTLWDTTSLPRTLEHHRFAVVHVSTPAAAVVWAWSLNHALQHISAPAWLANSFSMRNPAVLGLLWGLELLPSLLGRSANMRVLAVRADT